MRYRTFESWQETNCSFSISKKLSQCTGDWTASALDSRAACLQPTSPFHQARFITSHTCSLFNRHCYIQIKCEFCLNKNATFFLIFHHGGVKHNKCLTSLVRLLTQLIGRLCKCCFSNVQSFFENYRRTAEIGERGWHTCVCVHHLISEQCDGGLYQGSYETVVKHHDTRDDDDDDNVKWWT